MAKQKKPSKTKDEIQNLTFEEAIGLLTEIVEKIETGQVPLQESLQQYEKGMALIGQCRRILEDAEKRIAEIESRYSPGRQEAEDEEEHEQEEELGEEGDEDEDEEDELF